MLQVSERRIEMSTTFEQDPAPDKALVRDSANSFVESFGKLAESAAQGGSHVAEEVQRVVARGGRRRVLRRGSPPRGVLHLVVPFRISSRTVAAGILTTVEYALGVDLGTTHTAAAVHADGRVEVVRLGDRHAEMPSLIYLSEDGRTM